MAVTLSLYAGAGAQLFDDNGNPLSGGKIYTYAAGTTTPLTAYTTVAGNIAHTNPIILDATGRVNEIWLTVGVGYKFVVTTADDVLIGTFDNIPSAAQSPAANDADSIMYEQGYTVTAGNFEIGKTYRIATVGTTNFTLIGATTNAPGVHFIATGVGSGTGTAEYSRTVQQKFQERVSVTDFGADPTGVADSAGAILAAFAYIKSVGGGVVDFPNEGGAVYTISYGWRIPSNCIIYLNGCTIQATTTFGQGTIPATVEAVANSFFNIGRPNSESPLVGFLENISIIGDGAILDGRRDEQTGTIGGYTLVKLETTDTPVQVDNLKIRNILLENFTVDRSGYDGVYIAGAQDLYIDNVIVSYALRIGFVGISGENVTFNNCQANLTVGDNPSSPYVGPGNSGDGFWNEPNQTWQAIQRWSYVNCRARENYQSGFKVWNAGPDAQYHITLDNCYSYSNVYDPISGTLRNSPGEAGFIVNTNATSAAQALVVFNNCVAERELGSGFIISPTGGGGAQQFILNNCVALNCNINNTNSINRAPIRIGAAPYTATPKIVINSPTIIAPNANTLGFGIYAGSTINLYISNPVFINTFTAGVHVSTTYTPLSTEREKASLDAGSAAHILDTRFNKPAYFALFDQTSQPDPATEIFKNELVLWQNDSNQVTGVYRRDDSDTPKYLNFNPKPRLRGVFNSSSTSVNILAQDVETGTITVTGAALGDIVAISATANLNQNLILTARVSAADTVSYYVHNPSAGTVTRAATFFIVNVFGSDF